jgi:signal transduction histidine kinase/DNA-binding response OmpR family regulator
VPDSKERKTTPTLPGSHFQKKSMGHEMNETEQLRQRVAELENQLVEEQRKTRAKGDFLSNMSHEIRTPLNAIIGMTSIGKSSADPERKDYAFERIENAGTHLLGVINRILDMSKIESGKFELNAEAFNFEKVLQKVVNVIGFRVDERNQSITVQIDSNIPHTLIGDDQRLAEVLTNLLSNAVKFTPEDGAIHLRAALVNEADDICEIRFGVKDNGIGISPEQQAKLFNSFQQADITTARKYGGTGLGLALCKRIVELMEGNIRIDSELGKGSDFIFSVKMKRGAADRSDQIRPEVNCQSLRVIAVDDDSAVREYFMDIFQRYGIRCDTAHNGEEALRLIEENGRYDLYFVDWKMPGMDGMKLTRHIKGAGNNADDSVVIMVSSSEWGEIESEALEAGVDKFILKPIFPSDIVDSVNIFLGKGPFVGAPASGDIFAGRTILLAEDVDINREIVAALLEPTEITIDAAENGRVAAEMFEANPEKYDLIFMDVQMPVLDGYDATRRIRAFAHPRAGAVPIVAMTANVFREDVEHCLAAGMNSHIGKPIDFAELTQILREYLA